MSLGAFTVAVLGLVYDMLAGWPNAVEVAKVIIPAVLGIRAVSGAGAYMADSVWNSPRGIPPVRGEADAGQVVSQVRK